MQLRKHRSLKNFVSSAFRPLPGIGGLIYRLEREEGFSPLPQQVMERIAPRDDAFRQLSFTFAAIALSAHVASAGGKLSREKYLAFRDAFPLQGGVCGKIRKLFVAACENPVPFEHYVIQVKYIFPRRLPLFCSLIERLFSIASASGGIAPEADRMLSKTAHMLELSPAQYSKIRDRYAHKPRAHEVLGVAKKTKSGALKKRYREMMRRYHPDRFATQDLSPEVEMLLRLKTSEINEAYRALLKKAA